MTRGEPLTEAALPTCTSPGRLGNDTLIGFLLPATLAVGALSPCQAAFNRLGSIDRLAAALHRRVVSVEDNP